MAAYRVLNLHVDEQGYIYVGGIKVARYIPERGTLQFCDDNRHRSMQRGCRFVEVPITELVSLMCQRE